MNTSKALMVAAGLLVLMGLAGYLLSASNTGVVHRASRADWPTEPEIAFAPTFSYRPTISVVGMSASLPDGDVLIGTVHEGDGDTVRVVWHWSSGGGLPKATERATYQLSGTPTAAAVGTDGVLHVALARDARSWVERIEFGLALTETKERGSYSLTPPEIRGSTRVYDETSGSSGMFVHMAVSEDSTTDFVVLTNYPLAIAMLDCDAGTLTPYFGGDAVQPLAGYLDNFETRSSALGTVYRFVSFRPDGTTPVPGLAPQTNYTVDVTDIGTDGVLDTCEFVPGSRLVLK
ncbi:hypothetical protein Pla163_34870 [Planctomycetes bacterium Pla163]|uniref:Uncharacterized protein n=1 Tax=Rohdeia mirabilis TaxID=2528008 RepID=A0A518D4E0_9BACT|nr:hypothetical protein Pla163_34870 [Planctomycetes bacterium Pla163]